MSKYLFIWNYEDELENPHSVFLEFLEEVSDTKVIAESHILLRNIITSRKLLGKNNNNIKNWSLLKIVEWFGDIECRNF